MSTIAENTKISKSNPLKNISLKKYVTGLLLYAFLFVMIVEILCLASKVPDSDSFFIIRTGEYIVQNKEVPTTNPFVIHEDFDVIIQQWGFDAIIYILYSIFGYAGLFACSAVLFLLATFLMSKFIDIYTENVNYKLILLFIFVYIYRRWAVVRPTSFSFNMLLSVIIIAELYRRGKKKWMIALLPFISLALVNLHASMWPLMFVMLLPYICPNVITLWANKLTYLKSWWREWRMVLFVMLIMFAVGFLNPYGFDGMTYVIKSYGAANTIVIEELTPPAVFSIYGALIISTIIALAFYVDRKRSSVDSANCYMALGTSFMAMTHKRNTWFCFFGAIPLFAKLLEYAKISWLQEQKKLSRPIKMLIALLLCIVVLLTSLFYTFHVSDGEFTPTIAADYLDQFNNQEDIILYTDFNNGAYMEFRGYKVYMDARPELFSKKINNKEDVLTEWALLDYAVSNVEGVFDKYGFTHVLIPDAGALYGYMRNNDDFEEIINGKGYVLYQRIDWVGDSKYVHNKDN